eukprot:scaffold14794_cov96-Isochrysis_galbana.AAC.9
MGEGKGKGSVRTAGGQRSPAMSPLARSSASGCRTSSLVAGGPVGWPLALGLGAMPKKNRRLMLLAGNY